MAEIVARKLWSILSAPVSSSLCGRLKWALRRLGADCGLNNGLRDQSASVFSSWADLCGAGVALAQEFHYAPA
jgi:hypothetical protein